MEGRGVPHAVAVAVAGARCAGAASSERFVEVARRACPVAAQRRPGRQTESLFARVVLRLLAQW